MSVRRIGSGAAFATTRLAQKDECRSNRSGRRGSGNGKQGDFVLRLNCPTQANIGLEWATLRAHAVAEPAMASCTLAIISVGPSSLCR